jgi:hypothetical protein
LAMAFLFFLSVVRPSDTKPSFPDVRQTKPIKPGQTPVDAVKQRHIRLEVSVIKPVNRYSRGNPRHAVQGGEEAPIERAQKARTLYDASSVWSTFPDIGSSISSMRGRRRHQCQKEGTG